MKYQRKQIAKLKIKFAKIQKLFFVATLYTYSITVSDIKITVEIL